MADIKRPNYFTSQFLVAKDFDAEQAYHLASRRRHNRVAHTGGVVEGLDVTLVGGIRVHLGAGTAIDADGREIVLTDPVTYTLATGGSGRDVYLAIAYREVLDPADQYPPEPNIDTRTTERPLVQDSAAVPPSDGAVIVLARIRLNSAGLIESNGSIDTTVRTFGGAYLAPSVVTTTELMDGAVKLAKLADEVKPLTVQGGNAITVVTDDTVKRITIGESHSARTDDPHGTTAAHIDTQDGANQLVTQINAGTVVIPRSRIESAVASGVVTFQNLTAAIEMFSDDIDPGFGPGPVSVELAMEDVPAVGFTSRGRPTSAMGTSTSAVFRSVVDRTTGRFVLYAARNAGGATGSVAVRWTAFSPTMRMNTSAPITAPTGPAATTPAAARRGASRRSPLA
jgi:hypothetical protein